MNQNWEQLRAEQKHDMTSILNSTNQLGYHSFLESRKWAFDQSDAKISESQEYV